MRKLSVGEIASKGIALGKLFHVDKIEIVPSLKSISDEEKERERSRFVESLKLVSESLKHIAEIDEIFTAHLEILEDPILRESVLSIINTQNKNAELALAITQNEICNYISKIEDEYLKERASDIKDICSRIMKAMKGISDNPFGNIDSETIVFAENLAPSDTAMMDFSRVCGLITKFGGMTSHVSIIARSKGVPAIIGLGEDFSSLKNGEFAILDGFNKEIIINPEKEIINTFKKKALQYSKFKGGLLQAKGLKSVTKDNREVNVFANVGSVDEIESAMKCSAMGIGLYRTEFLFMQSKNHFPDEEFQFKAYKNAAESCKGKSLTIRTLDIGGDKSLPYFPMNKEDNPFLGWRAIRISLRKTDLFRTQLRALLRASAYGDIKIMFPMIISLEEFRTAKALIVESKEELRKEGQDFNDKIEIGVMIETPASVFLAEDLAKEADFFSIGTNDLIQYILVVDRTNQQVAHLGNAFHPSVIRSLKIVIDAANKYGKPVGMCGELAGNIQAVELLIGMGLFEFSVSPSIIPEFKQKIRNISFREAKELAAKVNCKNTLNEVISTLKL